MVTKQIAKNPGQNNITIIRTFKDDNTVHVQMICEGVTCYKIFRKQLEDQPGSADPGSQPQPGSVQDQPPPRQSQQKPVPSINIQKASIKKK